MVVLKPVASSAIQPNSVSHAQQNSKSSEVGNIGSTTLRGTERAQHRLAPERYARPSPSPNWRASFCPTLARSSKA